MSVGCLEPQFFKVFIELFVKAVPNDFDPFNGWHPDPSTQSQRDEWHKLAQYLTKGFLTRPRDFWAGIYQGKMSFYFLAFFDLRDIEENLTRSLC